MVLVRFINRILLYDSMFGFGKGKVEIQLQKYNFSPGEFIQGTAVFKLKKILHARAVNVRLIGQKKTSSYGLGNKTTNRQTDYVFDFIQPLDVEKDYSGEFSYNFQIKIPENVLSQPKFGGDVVGTLVKSAQLLSGVSSYIKWYVAAYLDIPSGFDVSKKVQVNIA